MIKILFSRYSNDRDMSELTQLALRAWPAILGRDDVAPEEAAELAYQAAVAMLEAVRQTEGAYDAKPWSSGGSRT